MAQALNQRVTIQQSSATRDANGGEVRTWSTFATVWASVEPVRGREFVALSAAQSEVTTKFRLRYLAGITSDMRVVWRSETYEIVGPPINVYGRDRMLELMAVALAPAT